MFFGSINRLYKLDVAGAGRSVVHGHRIKGGPGGGEATDR